MGKGIALMFKEAFPEKAVERKQKLFNDRLIGIALVDSKSVMARAKP
jgi:hypothetical protein